MRGTNNVSARLGALANRLTERDRRLCELVWEHLVLTTLQCQELEFRSANAAQHRLLELARMEVLDRFRPAVVVGVGSTEWHYVLGPMGAAVLAARHQTTVRKLGYRREDALGIAHSPRLAHTVGVNGFFTALVAHARRHKGAALRTWWSERRCRERWGQIVRPDGYGQWQVGARRVDFFVEYDRGTEGMDRLVEKIADGYEVLAEASGIATPVLFWLPDPRREDAFYRHIQRELGTPEVPVATATSSYHPAAEVWRLLPDRDRRCSLVELPTPVDS